MKVVVLGGAGWVVVAGCLGRGIGRSAMCITCLEMVATWVEVSPSLDGRGGSEGGREDPSPWRSMGDASWLGAAGGGGPMAAAAADAEERAERFVGLLPGGGGRPLFVDILQWELGLDQKRKVVVRGQER